MGKRDRTQDEKYNKEWEREIEHKMKSTIKKRKERYKTRWKIMMPKCHRLSKVHSAKKYRNKFFNVLAIWDGVNSF